VKNVIIPIFLSLLVCGTALAETRYVSDNLEITMRSGKGTRYSKKTRMPVIPRFASRAARKAGSCHVF
jgi:hypothetical protein